jgi:hypothetical protein
MTFNVKAFSPFLRRSRIYHLHCAFGLDYVLSACNIEIVFDTIKSSRKYPNLVQRPACSFVIAWSGEQTLQLEGIAEEPKGNALKQFQDVYFAGLAGMQRTPHLARNCLFRCLSALDTVRL